MSLVLFYIAGALTLAGAIGVVGTRNIIHAAIFLLVSLMGVAGIYVLVFAEFLALVPILVGLAYLPYAGAGEDLWRSLIVYERNWLYNAPIFNFARDTFFGANGFTARDWFYGAVGLLG
ncbi:MAG: NADH-quinone oxidoreductase subunit J, partial [Chloroflexi bacterium]|nr:NADH-quinone oxidoreductase subunit J [Chloroflexota bacterium]